MILDRKSRNWIGSLDGIWTQNPHRSRWDSHPYKLQDLSETSYLKFGYSCFTHLHSECLRLQRESNPPRLYSVTGRRPRQADPEAKTLVFFTAKPRKLKINWGWNFFQLSTILFKTRKNRKILLCPRSDSNRHSIRNSLLRRASLPISSLRHFEVVMVLYIVSPTKPSYHLNFITNHSVVPLTGFEPANSMSDGF